MFENLFGIEISKTRPKTISHSDFIANKEIYFVLVQDESQSEPDNHTYTWRERKYNLIDGTGYDTMKSEYLVLQKPTTSQEGWRIEWTNPRNVEDLISSPKPNGYRALHISLINDALDYVVKIELQMRTNLMDALQESDPEQAHDEYKADMLRRIDTLVRHNVISEGQLHLARKLLSPDQEYYTPAIN
ncbi:MAG: hypothetical protein V1859_11515 [archaeon]